MNATTTVHRLVRLMMELKFTSNKLNSNDRLDIAYALVVSQAIEENADIEVIRKITSIYKE